MTAAPDRHPDGEFSDQVASRQGATPASERDARLFVSWLKDNDGEKWSDAHAAIGVCWPAHIYAEHRGWIVRVPQIRKYRQHRYVYVTAAGLAAVDDRDGAA